MEAVDKHASAGNPSVRFWVDGSVAIVELARPPHNFLDADLMAALVGALDEAADRDGCLAIVIASEGRSFCAGANFGATGTGSGTEGASATDGFRAVVSRFYQEAEKIFAIPKPLVAAVHGPAIGAGLGIALACDLRVTCPEAFFAANFVRLGIHPGFGLSVTLPELIGPGRAADLLLTGRRVGGEEALSIGLAERCVPADDVRKVSVELAAEIAEAAPLAVAATRSTLRRGLSERVHDALALELEEQARLMGTADAAEGISAMLARRPPKFEGK